MQALEGLDYAHSVELAHVGLADRSIGKGQEIHRNISPKNSFLSATEQPRVVKIGDYGLSKAFDMAGLGPPATDQTTFRESEIGELPYSRSQATSEVWTWNIILPECGVLRKALG